MHAYSAPLKVLGRGSFGEALLVTRLRDRTNVVVKRILPGEPQLSAAAARPDDPAARSDREEALLEVRVLRSLSHRHVVAYFDSFFERGALHIVLEYADGGDLAALLEARARRRTRRALPERKAADLLAQAASALAYVHGRGILHRDLKAANIFLTRGGRRLMLGDFGIARVLARSTELASTCIGTPFYMSPELCEDRRYGAPSDMWALGCVLYEMATLRHAFDAASLNGLASKIMRGKLAARGRLPSVAAAPTAPCRLTPCPSSCSLASFRRLLLPAALDLQQAALCAGQGDAGAEARGASLAARHPAEALH